jgi:REP element-mobilizing transposase RayT
MARPLRILYPAATYHVTSRGNERKAIFRDDSDRKTFLDILGEVVNRFGWQLYAYVLLDNHFHLFLMTPEANLSRGMHRLNQRYAQYFNKQHNRVGHLFQGRFKSPVIETKSYFLEVARYVVLNPVRARICKEAADYHWSSYRATVGLTDAPEWLASQLLLDEFDCWDAPGARLAYREFVAAGEKEKNLWEKLEGQFILGGDVFVAKIRALIDERTRENREYPKMQRHVGRPSVNMILNAVSKHCELPIDKIRDGHGGLARMLIAGLAVDEALSTLMPVADKLRLRSPSQVSALANRCRTEARSTPDLHTLRERIVKDLYPDPGAPLFSKPPPGDASPDSPF